MIGSTDTIRASGSTERMASYKRPRRIVFVDSLPTNPSGKVLKRELIAEYGTARRE
jgi:acyl-CoA synthetase (AMP-forming)/AMP-acid ligase II